jgi:hypothetical protein
MPCWWLPASIGLPGAHTLSGLLEEGLSIRAADMPGADDLMMRGYVAMDQSMKSMDGPT